MFYVTQSQNLYRLFDRLCDWLAAFPAGVFEKQQVIVPAHGVGVWLRQQLAVKNGLCTLVESHFLGSFEWECYERILPKNSIPSQSPLSSKSMQAKIYQCLHDCLTKPTENKLRPLLMPVLTQALQHFIQKEGTQLKLKTGNQWQSQLWSLAGQIANCFAQYVVYRPDWLNNWNNNVLLDAKPLFFQADRPITNIQEKQIADIQKWQQALWVHLFKDDFIQRQVIYHRFWQQLADSPQARKQLPRQVVLFTVLSLPPEELKFLRQLSRYTEVHLFHYNPSFEYWADIVDHNWLLRQQQKDPIRAQFRESRHPILSRLGKQARDTFKMLVNLAGGEEGVWDDIFEEQAPANLLQTLQFEILNLTDPKPQSVNISSNDSSLVVHACHNRLRQLETLREELYRLFATSPQTNPKDIVVFIPNLQEWAPDIRAVFSQPLQIINQTSSKKEQSLQTFPLPFYIAGAPDPELTQVWLSFKSIYTLLQQPFTHTTLIEWLSLPATQMIFGLTADEVGRISELLLEARFYCGFDTPHLKEMHLIDDGDTRFTFEATLNRLLLGMVMPEQAVHQNVLAADFVAKGDFNLIAILQKIFNLLNNMRRLSKEPFNASEWAAQLTDHLYEYLHPTDLYAHRQTLEQFLSNWQKQTSNTEQCQLPLSVVLSEINNEVEYLTSSSKPGDRITFARLGTLRPLPYQHVAALGLDSGQFPARETPISFDLMSQLPGRLGDRSRKDDDEGALLDALLQANKSCWLFYNGFDEKQQLPKAPAACLQYILEWINLVGTTADPIKVPAQQIIKEHSLYAFAPERFLAQTNGPFAIDSNWLTAAQVLNDQIKPLTHPLIQLPKTCELLTPAQPLHVSLNRLSKDLMRPEKHYLKAQRLRLTLIDEQPQHLPSLKANGLQTYALNQRLDSYYRAHSKLPSAALVEDLLPVGYSKQQSFLDSEQLHQKMQQAAAQIRIFSPNSDTEDTPHSLEVGVTTINANVAPNTDYQLLVAHESGDKRYLLKYWLQHLFWLALQSKDQWDAERSNKASILKGCSVILTQKQIIRFMPVSPKTAQEMLELWLNVWHTTMQYPWILPPQLLLNPELYQDQQPKSDWREKAFTNWNTLSPYKHLSYDCKHHPAWQLITSSMDDAQLESYFKAWLEAYGQNLYAPIMQQAIFITYQEFEQKGTEILTIVSDKAAAFEDYHVV